MEDSQLLKSWVLEVEGLYYVKSTNKATDWLHGSVQLTDGFVFFIKKKQVLL